MYSHGDRSLLPAEPDLEIVILGDVLKEVAEEVVRLVLVELVDALGERSVDEEALPACDRVRPDDGVGCAGK